MTSGMTTTWTRIQMTSPVPRTPVSHGAVQWRIAVSPARTSMPIPFMANRYRPGMT